MAPRSHPAYPAQFNIYLDSDNDGFYDYVLFNVENGGFGVTGQTVVAVANLHTGATAVVSFANVDLDSRNMIFSVPMSAVGLSAGQKFNFAVLAFDNYFTGALTDNIGNVDPKTNAAINPMTFTLNKPRFATDGGTGFASFIVPIGASGPIAVNKVAGGDTASPSQTGILFRYRDAKQGYEADPVTVTP